MAAAVESRRKENMKHLVLFLCLLMMFVGCGRDHFQIVKQDTVANGDAVLLRWNIPKGKAVAFKTAISPVDPSKDNVMKINLENMFDGISEDESPPEEITKALNRELRLPKDYSEVTILRGRDTDTISVAMISGDFNPPEPAEGIADEAYQKIIAQMEGSVQLRGDITPSGSIRTFYLESRQKNLLSMFFELPQSPVRIGDSWELDVNFVSMGHGFICDSAKRVNRVTLVSLEPTDFQDQIATLEYTLSESVKGKFSVPMLGEDKPTNMSFSFIGKGEFLVRKGIWKSFVGRMEMKGTGMMTADVQQVFAMEPMKKIPKEYLKLK